MCSPSLLRRLVSLTLLAATSAVPTVSADIALAFGGTSEILTETSTPLDGLTKGIVNGDYVVSIPYQTHGDLAKGTIQGKRLWGGYYAVQRGDTRPPSHVRVHTRDRDINDQIELNVGTSATGGHFEHSGVLYFLAESFLPDFREGFASDRLTALTVGTQNPAAGTFSGRMVIGTTNGLFVSEAVFDGKNTLWQLLDPTTARWAPYAPSGSRFLAPDSGFDRTTASLGTVVAFGVQFQGDYSSPNSAKNASLNFQLFQVEALPAAKEEYQVNLSATSGGFVSPSSGTYPAGTRLEILATPAAGHEFVQWSGDLGGVNPALFLTVDRDLTAQAIFAPSGTGVLVLPVGFSAGELERFFSVAGEASMETRGEGGLNNTGSLRPSGSGPMIHVLKERGFTARTGAWTASVFFQWEEAAQLDQKLALQIGVVGDALANRFPLDPPVASAYTQAYGFRAGLTNAGQPNQVYLRLNYVSDVADETFGKSFTDLPPVTLTPGSWYKLVLEVKPAVGRPDAFDVTGLLLAADSAGRLGAQVASRYRGSSNKCVTYSNDNEVFLFLAADGAGRGVVAIDQFTTSVSLEERPRHTLDLSTSGSGSVTPGSGTYFHGDTVTLQAVPDSGHRFTGWEGSASGDTNPLILLMDGPKTVVANFAPAAVFTHEVTVDPTRTFQTIDGFGTGANGWSSPVYVHYRDPAMVARYVRELGASMLRTDIWANLLPTKVEDWNEITYARFDLGQWPDQPNRGGVYARWMRDVYAARVDDMKCVATAWSPPPWMKTNGQIAGGSLKSQYYKHYAKFLAEWVKMMREEFLVPIYAISIQNELSFAQTFESCVYSTGEFRDMVVEAGRMFAREGLENVRIFGPEDMTKVPDRTLGFVRAVLDDPAAAPYLDILATHGYVDGFQSSGSASEVGYFWSKVGQYQRPFWITETSCDGPGWLETVEGNGVTRAGALLGTGGKLHNALTYGNVSAFLFWQFLDGKPSVHGFLGLVDGEPEAQATYSVARHFYRHIRPGAVRVSGSPNGQREVDISAFRHPGRQTLSVILINRSADAADLTVRFAQTTGLRDLTQRRTSASERYAPWPVLPVAQNRVRLLLPARSIVTLEGVEWPPDEGWVTHPVFGETYSFGAGWGWSAWLGYLYFSTESWVYRPGLGWLYPLSSDYLYHPDRGWIWVTDERHPRLYALAAAQWLSIP